jgi:hypothetical protein
MSPYHSHLEECGHCATNPFDLCPIGAQRQSETAAECRPHILVIERPLLPRTAKSTRAAAQIAAQDRNSPDIAGPFH